MSATNRTSSMIIALVLCGAAPALAQTTLATPEHVPLQKTIGQAGSDIVPSLIVMNARGDLNTGSMGTSFEDARQNAEPAQSRHPH